MSNLPPSQQNMNSPAVTNGNPTLRLLGFLAILIGSVIVGLAIAAILYYFSPTVYQSNAKFVVMPRSIVYVAGEGQDFSSVTDVRHDQLLPQLNIILACLQKNNLDNLRIFDDLPTDEIASFIQENLSVTQNGEEPAIYTLAFRCNRPQDAQIVVSHLMATYERHLGRQTDRILQPHRDAFDKKCQDVLKEYEAAKKDSDEKSLELAVKRVNELDNERLALSRIRPVSLQVLDPASKGEKVWPSLPLLLVYGAVGGFVVGMCLVLLWSFLLKLT